MHFDAPIYPSKYRLVLMVGFVFLVAVLGVALGLGWWQWAVFGLVLIGVGFWITSYNRLLHLVSSDDLWECLIATYRQEEVWQVRVSSLRDLGFCVVIDGMAIEPVSQSVRFVIFADMLDGDDYRRLRAMARF